MMDILDKFLKKYSYKFPKGYPDLNDEQDINLLAELLDNMGINLEKNLEKKLESKNLKYEWAEDIYSFALKYKVDDDLLNYLNSSKILSFKDLGNKGNLFEIIKTHTDLDEGFIKKIINYTPDFQNRKLGKGEVALLIFFNAVKEGKGDVRIDNKELVELKGNNSRFSTEEGPASGRSGYIKDYFKNIKEKFPQASEDTDLKKYIENIFESYPESASEIEEYFNTILNEIYPSSKFVKITKENLNQNSLLVKYVTNYINYNPENTHYMLLDENFNYKIYTPSEFLDEIKKGMNKIENITPSSAYPRINL
mgnify:CR=1 FL=1